METRETSIEDANLLKPNELIVTPCGVILHLMEFFMKALRSKIKTDTS